MKTIEMSNYSVGESCSRETVTACLSSKVN